MGDKKYNIIVAVAGNPNVGKSTLFNILTGKIAHVANWPGVTVERKEGEKVYKGRKIRFVDLPGTYGISATSLEEVIAREYIISGEPDVVLVLVDGTAPERTLYLPVQILELTPNVVIAITKSDLIHRVGIHIHVDKLEEILKVPVVEVSAIHGSGLRELLDAIIAVAEGRRRRKETLKIDYGGLEPFISEIEKIVRKSEILSEYPPRWLAIRLLEGDPRLEDIIRSRDGEDLLKNVRRVVEAVRRGIGKEPVELITTARFNYVDSVAREVVVRIRIEEKEGIFEKMVKHEVISIFVSSLLLISVFSIIFTLNSGFPLNLIFRLLGWMSIAEMLETYSIIGLMNELFNLLAGFLTQYLTELNTPSWLVSLLADGVISGVGSILSFLPLIILTFFLLSLLEDSGIAARLAYSFNSLLNKFGLSGRAIYPLVISLGCNVPGVLSSRAALEEEERVQIIISTPFVPCQARLIVILAFITTYFSSSIIQALVMFVIYLIALAIAMLTSLIIRRVLYGKSEPPLFLLEIPPIHKPSLKVVWWLTWDYSKHFLKKAGLIILSLSIATWFLLNYGPMGFATSPKDSFAAIIGKILTPFLSLYGISQEKAWMIGFALFQGLIAKEGLIESIAMLQGEGTSIKGALLALELTPVQAFSLLLLFTLYVPCIPTIASIKQEVSENKLVLIAVGLMLSIAIFLSLLVSTLLLWLWAG
ncbi:MAG: ferrous iron transport protein B [Thermoprotei archaeon]|nr:MAG: ferrous iron transport protein B [Thermoprotei archaeon]